MREKIEISELINKYKKPLLNSLVILAALLISLKVYTAQEKKITALKQQKETELKKNQALQDIGRSELKLNSYKEYLNKKEISSAIKRLGEVANASSVRIISIKPVTPKSGEHYHIYPFNLTVAADDYHVLGKFVAALEKHPDVYLINSLAIRQERDSGAGGKGPSLRAEMQVSTILYKD